MARKQEGHWKRETDRQGFSAFSKPGLAGSLPCLFIIEGKGFAEKTPAKKEKGMLKTKFFTSLDRVFPETDWEEGQNPCGKGTMLSGERFSFQLGYRIAGKAARAGDCFYPVVSWGLSGPLVWNKAPVGGMVDAGRTISFLCRKKRGQYDPDPCFYPAAGYARGERTADGAAGRGGAHPRSSKPVALWI